MGRENLLYAIGKVAEKLYLKERVLRFWESQFCQMKPVKHKRRRP
ncbi:MerR family transcriptional regulator [Wolbachia endosymbiont of Onchocerca gibsoni]|nr:MerR family transcriptional regulator [Wolbachia endosymbiont of Onchocerca gibsoni]